jgi:hypothetical protein
MTWWLLLMCLGMAAIVEAIHTAGRRIAEAIREQKQGPDA